MFVFQWSRTVYPASFGAGAGCGGGGGAIPPQLHAKSFGGSLATASAAANSAGHYENPQHHHNYHFQSKYRRVPDPSAVSPSSNQV